MSVLKRLLPQSKSLVDESFCNDEAAVPDFSDFIRDFARTLGLEPLHTVVTEAMQKYKDTPERSDAWLAPRLHACLRLTRREAADKQIWLYLGVVELSSYVRWRFAGTGNTPRARFVGDQSKQALSRLWWGAELTRNGPDYSTTEQAFHNSRWAVTWAGLDLAHHKAAALAAAKFLAGFQDGKPAKPDQADRLAKAFNLQLVTTQLESVARSVAVDAVAMREWIESKPDASVMYNELPSGPDEEKVSSDEIDVVFSTLQELAKDLNLQAFTRRGRPPM